MISAMPAPARCVHVVDLARLFSHVREASPNAGLRVEAIQKWGGGQKGDSWCCWFATMVLDLYFQGSSPIPRTGSCQDVYELAKKNDWLIPLQYAGSGDLFLFVDAASDHAHHIGFVTTSRPFWGIAGNTSEDGQSSNGTGVFEHPLPVNPVTVKIVRFPR